eukprot:Transcript_17209.p1 GENE.Transcript_17209~~Transcript_17209.p1  ORF type:complete len:641 (-),score=-7.25 Transcript_17209:216-2138(-)
MHVLHLKSLNGIVSGCAFDAGRWSRNVNEEDLFGAVLCPLYSSSSVEPAELTRFRCTLHDPLANTSTLRKWHSCRRPPAVSEVFEISSTLFAIGDSLSQQHAKAFACRLLRESTKHEWSIQSERWFSAVNPARRPHRDRGRPFCVRVDERRVCFATGWPTVVATAELLIREGITKPGDTLVLSENMVNGEAAAQMSMMGFAAKVRNASSLIGQAYEAGVRFLWREKSPQVFSDSLTGAYQHHTYGSRKQRCATPGTLTRSPAVASGLAALDDAGVRPIRIWRATVTQHDVYLGSRTPYVAAKLDCTHLCEPSGVLEMWVDATLDALRGDRKYKTRTRQHNQSQFSGAAQASATVALFVLLGTTPLRVSNLRRTVSSFVNQWRLPQAIIVSTPRQYARFPKQHANLSIIEHHPLLTLIECAEDYGPATRILCAYPLVEQLAAAEPFSTSSFVVVADDDRVYKPDVLERVEAALRANQLRAAVSYFTTNVLKGVTQGQSADVFAIPVNVLSGAHAYLGLCDAISSECRFHDDVWMSLFLHLRRIPVCPINQLHYPTAQAHLTRSFLGPTRAFGPVRRNLCTSAAAYIPVLRRPCTCTFMHKTSRCADPIYTHHRAGLARAGSWQPDTHAIDKTIACALGAAA